MITAITVAAIILAYGFTILNGIHDGCNVIATIIASRSMPPRRAIIIACAAELIGPLFVGTAVAATIGKGVIKFNYINASGNIVSVVTILAALVGAICWNLLTWKLGIPSSSSHALIGGLLGAGIAGFGLAAIDWHSLIFKVILIMFASPLIGFGIGYIFMKLSIGIFKNFNPKINNFFKHIQVLSMIFLGTSHGSSDGQKAAGIITLLMVVGGMTQEFVVSKWILLSSTFALVFGISLGGWSIIKTVGTGIYKVKPLHSFNVQLSSAFVIFTSNMLGAPVSTTQIVSSSVMGIGSAERINAVKWIRVKNIVLSWFITIPAAGIASMGIFYILKLILI
ncbi:inorganic phosphate transporter [Clostridium swellfunianum]|uniref:inorganic phosphate transporter n=1 Tax=Clostridium swellfunianum TaxID=1367462 RepID=UPI00202E507F|nr:inorganic phosphate transporter [Clostridium swellfunianum]